jgi:hypothetical protein
MQNLRTTNASIVRFQQLAFPDMSPPGPMSLPPLLTQQPPTTTTSLRPAAFTSPVQCPLYPQLPPIKTFMEGATSPPPNMLVSRSTAPRRRNASQSSHTAHTPSPTPSTGSECCGGFVDCTGLVEEASREPERRTLTSGSRSVAGRPSHPH